MEINQGDIYWYDPGEPSGSSPTFVRPDVVSQILTIDKSEPQEKIRTLSKQRIDGIVAGIKLLVEPREIDEESNNKCHI